MATPARVARCFGSPSGVGELRIVCIGLLGSALLASAVGAVHVQHLRRSLFVELQGLERERDSMQVEWGQLRLEQSAWATHDRIERMAAEQRGLAVPAPERIVLVIP